jgi:pyridoxamine 5'-phosphate oxidase
MKAKTVEAASEPIAVFREWFAEAQEKEINDPDAAALATATLDGVPSVRMVLVKSADERGFIFYTNARSRKGRELAANPRAAMCFHWKTLRRQVRAEGSVSELPPTEADAYFRTRPYRSQVGSAVSRQSETVKSREELLELVQEMESQTPGEIPRPEWWKGYVLRAERVEFWIGQEDRLHDRIMFERDGERWVKRRLFP